MARQSIVTQEIKNEINRMYANSIGSTEISRRLYISQSTVISWVGKLKNSGEAIQSGYFLKKPRKNNKFTKEEKAKINVLYDNGATYKELSLKYGLTPPSISIYILKPRCGGRKNEQPTINANGVTKFLKYATEKERFKFYTSSSVGELAKIIDKLVPFSNV